MELSTDVTVLEIRRRAENDIRSALQGKLDPSKIDVMIASISTSEVYGGEFQVLGAIFYLHIWVTAGGYRFSGDGGGIVGTFAGGGPGNLYTKDLERLHRDTKAFMFTSFDPYAAVYFYDSNTNLLGHFHAWQVVGGLGILGGTGSWTPE